MEALEVGLLSKLACNVSRFACIFVSDVVYYTLTAILLLAGYAETIKL